MQFLIGKLRSLNTGITEGIANAQLMIFLFLLWNFSFLQGFFNPIQFQRKDTFTFRCNRRYWSFFVESFAVFSENGAEVLDLAWKKKKFATNFEGCNDEIIFLRCDNISAAKEKLAAENLRLMLGAESQRVLPCFLVEVLVPEIELTTENFILDITENDLCINLEGGKIFSGNSRYVDEFTGFIMQNQKIAKNMEQQTEGHEGFGYQSHIKYLRLTGRLVAYFLAGKNFGEEFELYCSAFQNIIEQFEKRFEEGIDEGEFLEIFRLSVVRFVSEQKVWDRRKLPNFDFLVDHEFVLTDNDFFYFTRQSLESLCKGELAQMPFVRILRELDMQGYLKVTARGESNFSAVVNLINHDGVHTKKIRMIAIKKDFLEEPI